MQYKLHRVASNTKGWKGPSSGRLGKSDVGEYVKKNGFGFEDWNFDLSLASDGQMFGYTRARPAREFADQEFGIILATYEAGSWKAVGYYLGARPIANVSTLPEAITQEMAVDVLNLIETEQGRRDSTISDIKQQLQVEELDGQRWRIPAAQVAVFETPVAIPSEIFSPGRQRMSPSYNLTEEQFNRITKLAPLVVPEPSPREWEEGGRSRALHERSELLRAGGAVAAFKNGLTSFDCAVCGFDFEETYGIIGKGFIECHHNRPISNMRPGDKTKLSDLVAVCSNCHRMLHREPWILTVADLRARRGKAPPQASAANESMPKTQAE